MTSRPGIRAAVSVNGDENGNEYRARMMAGVGGMRKRSSGEPTLSSGDPTGGGVVGRRYAGAGGRVGDYEGEGWE